MFDPAEFSDRLRTIPDVQFVVAEHHDDLPGALDGAKILVTGNRLRHASYRHQPLNQALGKFDQIRPREAPSKPHPKLTILSRRLQVDLKPRA